MRPIANVDEQILKTALDVIEGSEDDGTKNIHVVPERYVDTDEKGAIRYDSELEVEEIAPGEEFPTSLLLWARTKSEIEAELDRR